MPSTQRSTPPGRGPSELPLSEKLFLVLILGSLIAAVLSFSYEKRRKEEAARNRMNDIQRAKALAYLTDAQEDPINAWEGTVPHAAMSAGGEPSPMADTEPAAAEGEGVVGQGPGTDTVSQQVESGGEDPVGADLAGTPLATTEADSPGESHGMVDTAIGSASVGISQGTAGSRSNLSPDVVGQTVAEGSEPGRLISGLELGKSLPHATRPDAFGTDGRSVFVPARLGLPLHMRGTDLWSGWPDVNQRRIIGTQGIEQLTEAFRLVSASRTASITDDLYRKGIAISFGEPSDFSGAMAHVIASFRFSSDAKPPPAPAVMPVITFNPFYVRENPAVLGAALVHEGTHFQQYLDGTLLQPNWSIVETEFTAWSNEAAFWDEARGATWPFDTALEHEEEFGYHTVLHGEAALRDLLAALVR